MLWIKYSVYPFWYIFLSLKFLWFLSFNNPASKYFLYGRRGDRRNFQTPSAQHINSTQKGHSFAAPKIPQFNTPLSSTHPSVPHPNPLSFTHSPVPHTPQFHTKNPSVPHQRPLSSTPKTPQFHPLRSSHPSVPHQKIAEECVELRGFWVWNWGVLV